MTKVTRKIHRPQQWTRRVRKSLIDRDLTVSQLAHLIHSSRDMVSKAIHQRVYPSVIDRIEQHLRL